MSHFKDNLAWSRFNTMQHRARGIPIPNMNAVMADNKRMADALAEQLRNLNNLKDECTFMAKQRDKYIELWLEATNLHKELQEKLK